VRFVERGNEILFQPVTKEYIRSMAGVLKSATSVTDESLYKQNRDRGGPVRFSVCEAG
jgi:hypothetical protein